MRKKQLLWQIYPLYLVIALISLAAMTWYDCTSLRTFYLNRPRHDLQARATLVEQSLTTELAAGKHDRINALCKELGLNTDMRITVVLPEGKVVGETEESPERMDYHNNRPKIIKTHSGDVGWATRYSDTLHELRRKSLARQWFRKFRLQSTEPGYRFEPCGC